MPSAKTLLTGYAIFVVYVLATRMFVVPAAKAANIPLLKDL